MHAWHGYAFASGARTAPDTFLRSSTRGFVRLVSERGHVTLHIYTSRDNRVYGTPPRCIREHSTVSIEKKKKKRGVRFTPLARYRSLTCHLNVRRAPHLGSWLRTRALSVSDSLDWNLRSTLSLLSSSSVCRTTYARWSGRATRHQLTFTHRTKRLTHRRPPRSLAAIRLRAPNRKSRRQRRQQGARMRDEHGAVDCASSVCAKIQRRKKKKISGA